MRNLFDQYTEAENRLTHALAVCLDEDRPLLRDFLKRIRVRPPVKARNLVVLEQRLPGDPPEVELLDERNGLPDIVVHDSERWCLLAESKIKARLTEDQLDRHERTLQRRGFTEIHRLTLTRSEGFAFKRTIALTWSELYEWLGKAGPRKEWAARLRSYLRAAEVRLSRDGYLTEGTLTMFDGFAFSETNPYTYGEAKRLLKLALNELRKNPDLQALGVDAKAPGRTAIRGRKGRGVWNFLQLKGRPARGGHTKFPHLTLAVHADHLEVSVTIPNDVDRAVKARLQSLGSESLAAINGQILRRAKRLLVSGGSIKAYAMQRHYLSQSSPATIDAEVSFNLETTQRRAGGRVKHQPEWADLFASLPNQKRSNIQFQYRLHLPWNTRGIKSRESLGLIVEGWSAMKPLLDALCRD